MDAKKTPSFLLACILIATVILTGCQTDSSSLDLRNFQPVANFGVPDQAPIRIEMDYQDAYEKGFVLPSVRQHDQGAFRFDFQVRNGGEKARSYLYKLYYRNDSYRFPDLVDGGGRLDFHPRSGENFYGSWETEGEGFRRTPILPADGRWHSVSDFFRISGNPRNEEHCFVKDTLWPEIDPAEVAAIKGNMQATPEWIGAIRDKAAANGHSVEEQMEMDALYMINQRARIVLREEPWKRNPRVGNYSFLLVVTTEEEQARNPIPDDILYPSLGFRENESCGFRDPIAWFQAHAPLGGETESLFLPDQLKVVARPPLNKGLYFSEDDYFGHLKEGIDTSCFRPDCNASEQLRQQAAFQEFFHHESADHVMENIPVRTDYHQAAYSREDYERNRQQYGDRQRVDIPIASTTCPCRNVVPTEQGLALHNPASPEGWRKENVGMITRHGFSYGKFRVKARLPSLLNPQGIWNGLTNAVWLISQSDQAWNRRAVCPGPGFIPKEMGGQDAPRQPTVSYSEIDFEIVKTSRSWPSSSYQDKVSPEDPSLYTDTIMVTCTNWDLACPGTQSEIIGVTPLVVGGVTNEFHRWNHWYQAVTTKVPAPNRELFGQDHYYFEIDWQPESITWRIGPEKDQLRPIVVMDASMTDIPNNQMLLAITQEYHLTEWWPMAPYRQKDLPVPLTDLIGEVLEIEIE